MERILPYHSCAKCVSFAVIVDNYLYITRMHCHGCVAFGSESEDVPKLVLMHHGTAVE